VVSPRAAGAAGFTLLELLVALAVFAVLSSLTYSALTSALEARDQTDQRNARRSQVMQAVTILDRDLLQAVARPIRDEFNKAAPAMRIDRPPGASMELTRAGMPNPRGEPRSALQRVAYFLDGERLIRRSWAVLDRTPQTLPRDETLLSGVTGLLIEAHSGGWQNTWPMEAQATEPGGIMALPRAVRVTLELEGLGELVRVLPVASGYGDELAGSVVGQ